MLTNKDHTKNAQNELTAIKYDCSFEQYDITKTVCKKDKDNTYGKFVKAIWIKQKQEEMNSFNPLKIQHNLIFTRSMNNKRNTL